MNKYVFGITGPTGAGKTTVCETFSRLGVKIIDADKVSRLVTKKGMPCLNELVSVFGDAILDCDGNLNRPKLASIVFGDGAKLEKLTDVSHRYIKKYIEDEITNTENGLIAIDGAVIIGSPVMDMCKKLVVVIADEETRLKRIIDRDNITEKAAKSRIASQMSCEEYISYADYIIENNNNYEKIGEEIERIFSKIKASAAAENQTA